MLDGKVVSAPVIRARIEDEGILEGSFTKAEADELAMLLRSGPLPAPAGNSIAGFGAGWAAMMANTAPEG